MTKEITKLEDLRWAQRQRILFIMNRLRTVGTINRSDVVKEFEITEQVVSGDFAIVLKLFPEEIVRDKSLKRYKNPKIQTRGKEMEDLAYRLLKKRILDSMESILETKEELDLVKKRFEELEKKSRTGKGTVLIQIMKEIVNGLEYMGRYGTFLFQPDD